MMANVIHDDIALVRSFSVLPSAARTASPDTHEYHGYGRHVTGLVVVLDVTAVTATPALTLAIQGVDRFSGKTWNIVSNTSAIATTGIRTFRVRPGITPANTSPDFAVADCLPPVFRIACTHGDADSITYSVSAHLIY